MCARRRCLFCSQQLQPDGTCAICDGPPDDGDEDDDQHGPDDDDDFVNDGDVDCEDEEGTGERACVRAGGSDAVCVCWRQ